MKFLEIKKMVRCRFADRFGSDADVSKILLRFCVHFLKVKHPFCTDTRVMANLLEGLQRSLFDDLSAEKVTKRVGMYCHQWCSTVTLKRSMIFGVLNFVAVVVAAALM